MNFEDLFSRMACSSPLDEVVMRAMARRPVPDEPPTLPPLPPTPSSLPPFLGAPPAATTKSHFLFTPISDYLSKNEHDHMDSEDLFSCMACTSPLDEVVMRAMARRSVPDELPALSPLPPPLLPPFLDAPTAATPEHNFMLTPVSDYLTKNDHDHVDSEDLFSCMVCTSPLDEVVMRATKRRPVLDEPLALSPLPPPPSPPPFLGAPPTAPLECNFLLTPISTYLTKNDRDHVLSMHPPSVMSLLQGDHIPILHTHFTLGAMDLGPIVPDHVSLVPVSPLLLRDGSRQHSPKDSQLAHGHATQHLPQISTRQSVLVGECNKRGSDKKSTTTACSTNAEKSKGKLEYTCRFCGEAFANSSALRGHMGTQCNI